MSRSLVSSVALMSVAWLGMSSAHADDPASPDPMAPTEPAAAPMASTDSAASFTKDTYPQAFVERPLTLPKGMIEIEGNLFIGLSKELGGKPISIAPNVYYAIDDNLKVGLRHSRPLGMGGGLVGQGICLNGEKEIGPVTLDLCNDKIYNNLGLDAVYRFLNQGVQGLQLGAHGGLDFVSLDPMNLSLRLGVIGQFTMDKLQLRFDPSLNIGVTKRDEGNKEFISVPVAAFYQVTPELAPFLLTGIGGPLDGFGDSWMGFFGLGALYAIDNKLDVGARFSLDNLYGKRADGVGAADARSLLLFANYRL